MMRLRELALLISRMGLLKATVVPDPWDGHAQAGTSRWWECGEIAGPAPAPWVAGPSHVPEPHFSGPGCLFVCRAGLF